jgi:ribosomal protein S18 acetylase RimI-like enzyme
MKKFTNYVENNVDINCHQLNSELIIISENNKQVGSLILCYSPDGKASVFSVAILEKHRGKGYSKRLMAKAITRAKEKGCKVMELNTEKENNVANNLYTSLGFEFKGLMDDYNNYQFFL